MDNLVHAIQYYKNELLDWYCSMFPDLGVPEDTPETLQHIAAVYGREDLLKKFEEEFGAYGHALTADEEMHGGNDYSAYERALDDDMANDTGKVWGLPPLEKWQNVDNLFKLVK